MINAILLFIKRPVFTTMLVMLLVVFGLNAYPTLGLDLYPDVDSPIVAVSVVWTGTSAEEMENLVTKPIEDAVSSVSGIKTLSSVSLQGFAQIVLEFEYGIDTKLTANDVREKVAAIRRRLPDQISEPSVQRVDLTATSVLNFSLASEIRSRGETRKIAWDIVKDELQRLNGVADVNVYGGGAREIRVLADPRKLEAYKINIIDLLKMVNAQNIDTPGGRISESGTEIMVRTVGQYRNIEDIKNIVILSDGINIVKIGDIAEVEDGWEEERTYARTDGIPSVLVVVQKQSGTNTVEVAERVKEHMDKMINGGRLPPDVKMSIVRDVTGYIHDNVHDMMMSLILGGLLAVLITFMFLQNLRATIISAIAIPTSIISTFFLMKIMGFTINQMSLMGLSLAVGILIDDAIVVIENIYRHIEKGEAVFAAAANGTSQIALAVMATTLCILAVFVPVGNMQEIIGQFFKQFGMTVAFAVAFSLFVAFTLTPMLSAYWLKESSRGDEKSNSVQKGLQKILDGWEKGFLAVQKTYKEVVFWALNRPGLVVMIAVGSLAVNLLLSPLLGKEFMPEYDSGEFNIAIEAPSGTSIAKMKEMIAPIEQEVLNINGLQTTFLLVGGVRNPVYKSSIGVKLKPAGERELSMKEIMDDLRVKFRKVSNLKIAVQNASGVGRGDPRPIQIGLRGPDLETLSALGLELADNIRKIPGTTDVDISSSQSEPEVQIRLDPSRMGQLGLNAAAVGNIIQAAFIGITTDNQFNVADKDYEIRITLPEADRMSINDISDLRIAGENSSFTRLGDIAEIKFSSGPTRIDREGRQRQIVVYSNTVGVASGDVITEIETAIIPDMHLPFGYSYRLVGQAQTMKDSFKEIGKALLLAIILIYMVLAAEFESFVHPLTIMVSLPLSLVGAILGLLVSGKTVNIISLIGIIMLMGLVTKNAILLIDYTNQLREQGVNIIDALIEAGAVRLRPILMTTMAMIFGMLPIALGWGSGAELRSSMGVVLVGGLITSTLLTLVVVPVIYFLIDKLAAFIKKGRQISAS